MIKLFKFLFLFLIFPAVGFTNTDDCQKLLDFSQEYSKSIEKDFLGAWLKSGDELNAWGITFQDYLDENYELKFYRTDDNYILIHKVHPTLSSIYKIMDDHDEEIDLLASDWSFIRINNIVEKINGKKVDELSYEEIKNEMDNFSTLNFFNSDGSESFIDTRDINKFFSESERSDTSLFKLNTNPRATSFSTSFRINSIQKIDSKHSQSQSVIVLNSVYEEKELASFIEKNYSNTLECNTDIKTAKSMGLYSGIYYPANFISTSNTKSEVTIIFFPKSFIRNLYKDFDDNEKGYEPYLLIEEETTFIGKFMHDFDLKNFPFDSQFLDFMFKPRSGYETFITHDFSDDQDETLKTNILDITLPEWQLLDAYKTYGDYFSEKDKFYMPSKGIRIEVERKNQYYIYKVLLPILIILAISWSIFWIRIEELESRVTISIVCMLSLIAYNFVIDDSLPKLGFLTLLDWFVVLSYIFSAIPTLESVIVHNLHRDKREKLSIIFNEKCRYLVPSAFVALSFLISVLYLYS